MNLQELKDNAKLQMLCLVEAHIYRAANQASTFKAAFPEDVESAELSERLAKLWGHLASLKEKLQSNSRPDFTAPEVLKAMADLESAKSAAISSGEGSSPQGNPSASEHSGP